MKLVSLSKFSLGRSNGVDEETVQQFIEQTPEVLNLGLKTRLIQKQRRHQGAGILDLLLESEDRQTRYVVELMLGELDEKHIVRAIEYWDYERRAYPDIAHVAVLVAEGLGRFLNVIGLLSGAGRIPIIVIQMNSYRLENDDSIALTFSRVLEQRKGLVEDESEEDERSQVQPWKDRVPGPIIKSVQSIFEYLKAGTKTELTLREVQQYIAVSPAGSRSTILVFYPQVRALQIGIRIDQRNDIDERIQAIGSYNSRDSRYLLKIQPNDVESLAEVFKYLGQILFQPSDD
jgi:hypothetical protein